MVVPQHAVEADGVQIQQILGIQEMWRERTRYTLLVTMTVPTSKLSLILQPTPPPTIPTIPPSTTRALLSSVHQTAWKEYTNKAETLGAIQLPRVAMVDLITLKLAHL
jgi:hypothetical protein